MDSFIAEGKEHLTAEARALIQLAWEEALRSQNLLDKVLSGQADYQATGIFHPEHLLLAALRINPLLVTNKRGISCAQLDEYRAKCDDQILQKSTQENAASEDPFKQVFAVIEQAMARAQLEDQPACPADLIQCFISGKDGVLSACSAFLLDIRATEAMSDEDRYRQALGKISQWRHERERPLAYMLSPECIERESCTRFESNGPDIAQTAELAQKITYDKLHARVGLEHWLCAAAELDPDGFFIMSGISPRDMAQVLEECRPSWNVQEYERPGEIPFSPEIVDFLQENARHSHREQYYKLLGKILDDGAQNQDFKDSFNARSIDLESLSKRAGHFSFALKEPDPRLPIIEGSPKERLSKHLQEFEGSIESAISISTAMRRERSPDGMFLLLQTDNHRQGLFRAIGELLKDNPTLSVLAVAKEPKEEPKEIGRIQNQLGQFRQLAQTARQPGASSDEFAEYGRLYCRLISRTLFNNPGVGLQATSS